MCVCLSLCVIWLVTPLELIQSSAVQAVSTQTGNQLKDAVMQVHHLFLRDFE